MPGKPPLSSPTMSSANRCARRRASASVAAPAIYFLQRDRSAWIVHVGQKSGDGEVRAVHRKIPVGHHVGASRRIRPIRRFQLARLAGSLRGIKTRADQLEDAAIIQVRPKHVVKCFLELCGSRSAQSKFRHRHARFRDSQSRAGFEPVLRRSRAGAQHHRERECNANCPEDCYFSYHVIYFSQVPLAHRLKSNQNSTLTLDPEYPAGSLSSGLASRIARTADVSTDAFPLDLVI
jgi:hypothetical protein